MIASFDDGKIYVLTAGGEVKNANIITENILDKLETSNEIIITKNGVRKKQKDCFIDNKGKVYTWRNGNIPICISDIEGNALNGKNIIDIYSDESIVIARDNNGKIYTWGNNSYGQLGNETTQDSSIPICISDIENHELKNRNVQKFGYDKDKCLIYYIAEGNAYIYKWTPGPS